MDWTRLLPSCYLGPPSLLTGCAAHPSRDQGPSGKLGLSVKRGQKQARGFLMGTPRVEWGLPCAPHSASWTCPAPPAPQLHPLDAPQVVSFGGPFHVAVVSLSQARLCPRAPREVHLLPYQDVKVQRQASGSSWLVPELPVLGLRSADLGSGPPCLVTTGCFRRPPSQGSRPWSCLYSLQGQVQPRGGGGICLLPQEELMGLTAAPWKVSLPVCSTH